VFGLSHPVLAPGLLLLGMFASGCLEALLKLKDLATLTWFMTLLALTGWIGHSLTPLAIAAAGGIFVSGCALIVWYRRTT